MTVVTYNISFGTIQMVTIKYTPLFHHFSLRNYFLFIRKIIATKLLPVKSAEETENMSGIVIFSTFNECKYPKTLPRQTHLEYVYVFVESSKH